MSPTIRQGTIDDLRELLQAIDRRLPRLTHADEPAIAKEAAALREQAVAFLARLEAREIHDHLETPLSQGRVGQTPGRHDQKDNRGSAGQEAEGDVRYQPAADAVSADDRAKRSESVRQRPLDEPRAPGGVKSERLTKSGRHKRSR